MPSNTFSARNRRLLPAALRCLCPAASQSSAPPAPRVKRTSRIHSCRTGRPPKSHCAAQPTQASPERRIKASGLAGWAAPASAKGRLARRTLKSGSSKRHWQGREARAESRLCSGEGTGGWGTWYGWSQSEGKGEVGGALGRGGLGSCAQQSTE